MLPGSKFLPLTLAVLLLACIMPRTSGTPLDDSSIEEADKEFQNKDGTVVKVIRDCGDTGDCSQADNVNETDSSSENSDSSLTESGAAETADNSESEEKDA
nr:uncharacterized protein LOC106615424 [Bactrocera oleae]